MSISPKQSVVQHCISWESAHKIVGAAAQVALEMGLKVNIAVVDQSGVLAAFLRQPGAPLHSIDIAIDKAYTSVSFGLPTSQWHAVLAKDLPAVREGLVRRPRFVGFGGGLPIIEDGVRIGGVGVSGASAEQDEMIAQAGLDALTLL